MRHLVRQFDGLPRFFQVLFVVFLAMPVLSWTTIGSPFDVVQNHPGTAAWVALFAYWIGPVALSAAVFFRLHTVAFFYMTECVALLGHAALEGQAANAGTGTFTRVALIACVAVLGLAFLHRDVSMPFFSARKRGFRGAGRLRVNSSLKVRTPDGRDVTAEMEDCSLIGMCLALGAPVERGDAVKVSVKLEKETYAVDAKVEWCVRDEALYRVGVSTTDVAAMAIVIKGVTLRSVPSY